MEALLLTLMMTFSADAVTMLHDQANRAWHLGEPDPLTATREFLRIVLEQHRANYELWHTEDLARKPLASDREVAEAKRLIDRINQRRNDLAEELDEMLLASLPVARPRPEAELHSETPGLIIDRLSILSLKLYHTHEEIGRTDAPDGHAERNVARLAILETQRDDLSRCLDQLWSAIVSGTRRFNVYRQLKMYNDPALNPALYNAG